MPQYFKIAYTSSEKDAKPITYYERTSETAKLKLWLFERVHLEQIDVPLIKLILQVSETLMFQMKEVTFRTFNGEYISIAKLEHD